MNRHDSRLAAVQGLYSWDLAEDKDALDVTSFNWIEGQSDEALLFPKLLLSGTLENISEIDSIIKTHLSPKWDFSRLNKIALAVIRLSVYCLLYQTDTQPAIVIDEAIEIARSLGADDQCAFINGILDKISKEKRGEESS